MSDRSDCEGCGRCMMGTGGVCECVCVCGRGWGGMGVGVHGGKVRDILICIDQMDTMASGTIFSDHDMGMFIKL